MAIVNMLLPRAPVPTQADRDREHQRHAHRLDLNPTLVAADPWYTERPVTFLVELARVYGAAAALTLWTLAAEEVEL